MNISFIIPTLNRDTLKRTIDSIDAWEGDEILVEVDKPSRNMWGNPGRNNAMHRARGDYLAFIDDDDYYVPNHRHIMQQAIDAHPAKPILFRMRYPNGDYLWKTKEIIPGNIGSAMILVPNQPERLVHWKDGRNMADFIFVDHWSWKDDEVIWSEEVIALLGHDGANYATT